jgi:hypothetical protein
VRSHPLAVVVLVVGAGATAGLVFFIQFVLVMAICAAPESGDPCHSIGPSTWALIGPPLALLLAVATAVLLRSPLAAAALGFLWTAGFIVFDALAFR